MRQVAERLYSASRICALRSKRSLSPSSVAVLGWMTGTQDGPFGPYPPSGKAFRVRQIHTYAFDDQGRIANHVAVRDDVAMLDSSATGRTDRDRRSRGALKK
jgi:hypothetical protein